MLLDFNKYFENIDLKKTPEKKGLHFEQKITPDLLWCISQVLLKITENDPDKAFSDGDIRKSDVFNVLMRDYFSKAEQSEDTENEYNKVSSYQLGLLTYSGILEEVSTHPKIYKIKIREILSEMANHELNSLEFLKSYVHKFLQDNSLLDDFEAYRNNQIQEYYKRAKDAYWGWARNNTQVITENPRHSNRVFNKLFNIYAYTNNLSAEHHAHIVPGRCPYSYLVYKRINFRDEDMPRGMSRRDFSEQIEHEYRVQQKEREIKNEIRSRHPHGEIQRLELGYSNANVYMGHHILPQEDFPNYRTYRENIIMLTPDQHYGHAHTHGTMSVDKKYQLFCLYYKLISIEASTNSGDGFYDIRKFIEILNSALHTNYSANSSISILKSYIRSIEN